jgi:chromate transport protein ChrA
MAATQPTPLLSLRAQQLFPALIGVFTIGIVSSIADVLVSALGSNAVGIEFSFRLWGLFLALAPQVGMMLALIAAFGTLAGNRVAVRIASAVAVVIGVALLIILIPFGLDFLQSRRMVPDAQMHGFTLAGVKTAAFGGLFGLILIWAGWLGVQASVKPDQGESRTKGQGLVVGQE